MYDFYFSLERNLLFLLMLSKYFVEKNLYDLGERIGIEIFIAIKTATRVIHVAIANTGIIPYLQKR